MKEIATVSSANAEACTGNCSGCGKTHIKIFGHHNAAERRLAERVHAALQTAGIDGKVLEISDPVALQAHGVRTLPALMVEGEIVLQGLIPSVPALVRLLKNKGLYKSKLYRLRTISVPVDMSEVSANALIYAWHLAQRLDSQLEIVYAMDSIFEGTTPSSTGFLSGYTQTMHTELDTFVTETMAMVGVQYVSPARFAGGPGQTTTNEETQPRIHSKVIYGAPDVALADYSRNTDLIVMGATGRGGIGKKLFGSVSVEVSRNAHCPVLFVPKEASYRGLSNLLYASDFDSLNTLCVQQAAAFAQRFDGQIHFVHVGPGGEKNLEEQRARFEADFGESVSNRPFVFSKMVSDDISGALYEYAFYHRIDLLVFVTHHRNFWDNLLHKSVTNEVVAGSDLPILVIHSDDDLLP
ncbi:MAG: universal stress protein [Saprospiraceae bacterium]|nr:universal stress protein [Saprospiraceae bacterium]